MVLLLLATSLVAVAPLAGAAPAAPPGNNGTVKIDGVLFDSHPNNEPHVGCVFQVDFYGFDLGDLDAEVTFEAQPPTGRGILLTDTVFIGEDAAGGGTDLDATVLYDLSAALASYTPHPQQGFHVYLTVNAEGSQGADTKHKVFWVSACDPPTTTTTSTTTTSTTTSTTTTTTAPPTGTIIIEKYALGTSTLPFNFSGDLGPFVIVDDELGTGNVGSQVTFTGLSSGDYVVTESPAVGWQVTAITCVVTPAGGNSTFVTNVAGSSVTISLADGETVYCDFANKRSQDT